MANAISVGRGRRVVAQWMWLIASSCRSAVAAAVLEEMLSSAKVGYSGEQSSRETAKAPLALA